MSYICTQNSQHTSMLQGARHSFFFFLTDFFLLAGHRGIALGHSPFSLHPPTTNICCKSATPKPNCLQLTQKAIKKLFLCSSWKERQPDVWLVDLALF